MLGVLCVNAEKTKTTALSVSSPGAGYR